MATKFAVRNYKISVGKEFWYNDKTIRVHSPTSPLHPSKEVVMGLPTLKTTLLVLCPHSQLS